MKNWIQTKSGIAFDLANPRAEDVRIADIAYALARINRFTGHANGAYSVAQHCVHVSDHCPEHPAVGLLHDASEAYVGDVSSPLKRMLAEYRQIERAVLDAIFFRWRHIRELNMARIEGLPPDVKHADLRMLATEKRDLMGPAPRAWDWLPEPYSFRVVPWPAEVAERRFLERAHELGIKDPPPLRANKVQTPSAPRCHGCGHAVFQIAGTCSVCQNCGSTTGCS